MALLSQKTSSGTDDDRKMKSALSKGSKEEPTTNDDIGETKKVQFRKTTTYVIAQHVPADEEERKKLWYTPKEEDEAKKNESILQTCISNNGQLYQENRENLNAQGVLTKQQLMHMAETVAAATTAVLEEQERQESEFYKVEKKNSRGEFELDFEGIAAAYREHSKEALARAQRRAARHETHLKASGVRGATAADHIADDAEDTTSHTEATSGADGSSGGGGDTSARLSSLLRSSLLKKSLCGVRKLIRKPSAFRTSSKQSSE